MRRIRKSMKKIFIVGCLSIALCIYFNEQILNMLVPERQRWLKAREALISHFRNNISFGKYFVNEDDHSAICYIPKVDPFEENALKEWSYRTKEYCDVQKYGFIENNRLIVNVTIDTKDRKSIRQARLDYIQRGRKRKADGTLDQPSPGTTGLVSDDKYKYDDVINDDFHVHFKEPSISLIFNQHTKRFQSPLLEHDFIRLRITKQDGTIITEYHTHIANQSVTCRRHGRPLLSNRDDEIKKGENNRNSASKGLPYNVHMIMVDAQSVANMHRQVPKLMAMLERDENAMLFKAHGIHGDGTTCQLLATLAGKFDYIAYQ